MANNMKLEEAIAHLDESLNDQSHDWGCEECKQEHKQLREWLIELKERRAAEVVEVHAVIDRMNKERKRAKGNWHTDPYWLGWVDAMRRAERIVDGTIDDEPMYAPSNGEKMEGENNERT